MGKKYKNIHVKYLIRYSIAFIVVLGAFFIRQELVNILGGQLPTFITFYPAVILIALLEGMGPGIFATIAATLFAMFHITLPLGTFAVDSSTDIVSLSIFFSMGIIISVVSKIYQRNREKLATYEKELELMKVSDEIRLKDKLLHLTGEMAKIGGWEFDTKSGAGTWTDEVARIHDLNPKDPTNVNLGLSFYSGESRKRIENAIKDAIELAKPYDLELEIITGKENHKIVRTMGLPIQENGKVTKLRGIFQDITEFKQADEKLKAHERTLKLFVEHAPASIAMFDHEMRYIAASRRFSADYRLAEQDIIGRSHYDIFPELPERWKEIYRRCLLGAIEKADKDPFPRSDGTLDYVRWEIHPWYEDSGKIGGIILFSEVITEQVRAQEKIKESEDKFKIIADFTYDWEYWRAEDGSFYYVSPSSKRITGYSPSEFMDTPELLLSIIHPDDRNVMLDHIKLRDLYDKDKQSIEFRIMTKNGDERWISHACVPVFLFDRSYAGRRASNRDITKQKRAEKELIESEEKYRLLIESIKKEYFIYRNDINGVFTYISPSITDVLGYSTTELDSHFDEYLTDNPINQKINSYVEGCMNGVLQPSFEVEIWHKDRSKRYLEISLTPLFELDGKVVGVQGIAHDITERKRADSEMERMITAIEQAGEAIVVTDINGMIQYVNPAFEEITGYSREEAIGNFTRILKSGKHNEAFYQELWQKISGGQTWSGRLINRRKNGNLYTEATTISPIRDSSGKVISYVAVKKDITEFLQLEKQFLQAQKMESVGRLAGGVAHDYNNMLGVILGYTEMALTSIPESDPLHEYLQEIFKAAVRSRDITRQLLAFARKEIAAPEVLNLNETVESMLKILRKLIGEDVNLVWRPSSDLWPIKIDPTQLNQILANLCVNSRDAIDNIGNITIETDIVTFDDEYCKEHPDAIPGDFVMLAVSDDGCGMSRETMDNIFEPFFTTKKKGQGTGLGLATVYGIVKQNNGFIYVYSELRQGTTFKIYLPRHIGEVVNELKEEGIEIPKGRGEVVLVVEDDISILIMISKMLKNIGYKVITANTPGEAIQLFEVNRNAIQLLITDVIIPDMSGKELAERLKTIQTNLRCIFMSGYTADKISRHGVLDEGIVFLQKPFSTKDLAIKVRMALDKK